VLALSGCSGNISIFSDVDLNNAKNVQQQAQKKDQEIWEVKRPIIQPLKIGIITDTQVHASRINKWQDGAEAERYLKPRYGDAIDAFVSQMMKFQPDVIVVPGDIVEGTNDDDYVSIAGLQLVQEKIEKVGVPVIWVVGNHELRSVTKQQYMDALGIDYLNGAFEFGEHKIIVIDGNFYPDDSDVAPGGSRYIRGHVDAAGIAYLEEELQTDLNTIVFIHQPPLVGEDIVDRSPEGLLDNGKQIQSLLTSYNAIAAIGGHIEYKRHTHKNGVSYYALPGTIKSDAYPGAFYEAVLDDSGIHMTMYYMDKTMQEYRSYDFSSIPDGSGKAKNVSYED
jgi:Icc-related predicted phosphoesterase